MPYNYKINLMKQNLILCTLTAFLSLQSCAYKTVSVRYDGRLVERYQIDRKTNERHGFYRLYHSNRKVALEHTYNQGKLNGIERIYHENGALAGTLALKEGKYHGHFTYYYIDGTVKQQGYYRDDKIVGDLTSYYRNGRIKESIKMHNNTEDGPFRLYSDNGVLIKQGNYITIDDEAVEDGLLYEYDPQTMKMLSKKRCREGY